MLFCWMLLFTGARLSEISNIQLKHLDFSNKTVAIRSLKLRKKGVFRELPLPDLVLSQLHHYLLNTLSIKVSLYAKELKSEHRRLWRFSTRSASRYVKHAMDKAEIVGVKASALGLRHGFAVEAVTKVPITLVKRWLGHTHLETTEIYLNVVGLEERIMAERMWEGMMK